MIKRIAASAVALAALAAGVFALTNGSTAAGGISDATRHQQQQVRDAYAVLETGPVSGPSSDGGWPARFRKITAARGGTIGESDIRTAIATNEVTVNVALTDKNLCFRVADSGGGGSVGCSAIDEAGTASEPHMAVDKTDSGMRITVLSPDDVSGLTIRDADSVTLKAPVVNNVATARTDAAAAVISWTDGSGKSEQLTVKQP